MGDFTYAILVIAIAALLAGFRFALKLVAIDKFLAFSIIGIFASIFGLIAYYFYGNKEAGISNMNMISMIGIFLAAFCFIGNGVLILQGFNNGYNLSTFTVAYSILTSVFVIIAGYFFFKDTISLYQLIGLCLSMISVYLLSLK